MYKMCVQYASPLGNAAHVYTKQITTLNMYIIILYSLMLEMQLLKRV